jgi:sugar (pentulose or hexulose) kinase
MSTVSRDQAETPFILSLDIGTSSVRAAIFDRLGRAMEDFDARQFRKIVATKEGASETDPDNLLELLWLCIDDVIHHGGFRALTLTSNHFHGSTRYLG